MENHKRGRSVDSGLTMEVKDNDLVLFSDMQMRESENFLLNSSEDFDDSLCKCHSWITYFFICCWTLIHHIK